MSRAQRRRLSNRQKAILAATYAILLGMGDYSTGHTRDGVIARRDTSRHDVVKAAMMLLMVRRAGTTPAFEPPPAEGAYAYLAPAYTLPTGMTYNADTGIVDGTVLDTDYATNLPAHEVQLTDQGSRAANYAALVAAWDLACAGTGDYANGTRIRLAAGADYGGAYTPDENLSSGWIYIEANGIKTGSLPEGVQVAPADAALMPQLYQTAHQTPVVDLPAGNCKFRFVGLEFALAPSGVSWWADDSSNNNNNYGFVASIALATDSASAVEADYPHDVTVDRCYLHGIAGKNLARNLRFDGIRMAVIDSWLTDVVGTAISEGQNYLTATGHTFKIVNNYMAHGCRGESFLFGGTSWNIMPADIEIQRNQFDFPVAWHGTYQVKNNGEFKLGDRALVQGNRFTNYKSTGLASQYVAFVAKATDQLSADTGGALSQPTTRMRDLTFRLNEFRNCDGGQYQLSIDEYGAEPLTHVDVCCNRTVAPPASPTASQRYAARIFTTIDELQFRHNTLFCDDGFMLANIDADYGNLVNHTYSDNLFVGAVTWWRNAGVLSDANLTGWNDVVGTGSSYTGNATTNNHTLPSGNTSVADLATADLDATTFALNPGSPLEGVATSGRDPGAVHALLDDILPVLV